MTRLDCHWVCVSKQPRDSSDYRVLSCSGNQSVRYELLVRRDEPGTPTTEDSGRVESLPWVTFGRTYENDGQHSMSIMTWSNHQDAEGRPVTLTRVFIWRYAQLPRVMGYANLYRAAVDVHLPPKDDAEVVSLDLQDLPLAEGSDPHWAAATASVLLEGRVIITGLQDASVERRLERVDAVTRMLPRGYQADLTVATWVTFPAQRSQRLCFGPYAAGDLTEIRLDVNPTPRSELARRYYALLVKYLDSGQENRLVEWLVHHSKPLSFASDSAAALDILQDLDLPDAVVEEVRAGHGRLHRVLRALNERGSSAFDERGLYDVFWFVLNKPKIDVRNELGRYWSTVLSSAVVAAAHQQEIPAERRRIATAFVSIAREKNELDAYLTSLVTPHTPSDLVPLQMFAVCLGALLDEPQSPYWPMLRQRMLDDISSGVSFVVECQDLHPEDLPYVLSWMVGDWPTATPPWLAVLYYVAAGNPTTPGPSSLVIEEAARQNPSTALQALDIASRRKMWDLINTALWQDLIGIARRSANDPSRQVLTRDLGLLGPVDAGPRARAYLDLVLEICALPAVNVPDQTFEQATYVDELASAIRRVSNAERPDVLGRLLNHATEKLITKVPRVGWVPAAEFLLTVLKRRPFAPSVMIADLVADILNRPRCGALLPLLAARGGNEWERLVTESARLRSVVPWLLFEESALANATYDELAHRWTPVILTEFAQSAPKRKPSITALEHWPSLTQDDALLSVIQRTRERLSVQSRLSELEVDEWWKQTICDVARDGLLGPEAAQALMISLRQAFDRAAQERSERLHQIERREADKGKQIKTLQDELARLNDDRVKLAKESQRWQAFLDSLSLKPRLAPVPKPQAATQDRSWTPAVPSRNEGNDRSSKAREDTIPALDRDGSVGVDQETPLVPTESNALPLVKEKKRRWWKVGRYSAKRAEEKKKKRQGTGKDSE